MTNTEMWLDETISHIKSVKSDIWMLHEIMSLPNCNDCKNKDCEYKPKWGEHIRYNCPLHTARKTESDSEKPSNCEVESLTCDGNCWMKKQNGEWLCEHCQRKPKTEPQTCANGCKWLNQDGECTEPSGVCHIEYRTEVDEAQTDCAWKGESNEV